MSAQTNIRPVDTELTAAKPTDLDDAVTRAMDALTSAMAMASDRPDVIEDAITAWRDRSVEDGREEAVADVMADVVTDAIRQAVEHRDGRSAVRVTFNRGARLTFSWLSNSYDRQDGNFRRMIARAVERALDGEVE